MSTNNQQSNARKILIVVVIVGVILFLAPRLFGNTNTTDDTVENLPDDNDTTTSQTVDDGIELGSPVIAEQVDRDGCPIDTVSTLDDVDTFYVVAPDSVITEGTDIFVRLYREEQPVEDLPLITANQDYERTCINFVFETTDGQNFEAGNYEAEFWVNGNSYNSINFEIQ